MESRVAKFFDAYASDFDAIYGTKDSLVNAVINRLLRRSMRLRFLRTLEGCHPADGKDILDVGCGPGHYSVALAKMGARSVLGIDFSEAMLEIARRRALYEHVERTCSFENVDFLTHRFTQRFDCVVAMGFMDYIEDAHSAIQRVLALTDGTAFFSFPAAGGLLAWQRRLRYRLRCPLFLYTEQAIRKIFEGTAVNHLSIERIARDYFVSAAMKR